MLGGQPLPTAQHLRLPVGTLLRHHRNGGDGEANGNGGGAEAERAAEKAGTGSRPAPLAAQIIDITLW
jgi:hypothetical protein